MATITHHNQAYPVTWRRPTTPTIHRLSTGPTRVPPSAAPVPPKHPDVPTEASAARRPLPLGAALAWDIHAAPHTTPSAAHHQGGTQPKVIHNQERP